MEAKRGECIQFLEGVLLKELSVILAYFVIEKCMCIAESFKTPVVKLKL